ncbi:MAG: sugar phosphate isomerase/epimerase [Phycisphaerales bacterium]|jgi:sugar phosphate isomerase/epimerase|nr:sugar phosphate isomerase/epimerase [Phycisphaerales bacterium]
MKIYMHVNFLEHVFGVDEIIARAATAGYDGVELRGFDVAGKEAPDRYVERCCDLAGAHKMDLVFGCPNDTRAGASEESMKRMKSIIRVVGERGVRILNVFSEAMKGAQTPYHHFEHNGSAMATDEDFTRVADYFREVGGFAANYGVNLCFETHNCYLHDLARPTCRLLELINLSNVKANFDYGNIHLNRNNLGMEKELDALAPHIGYGHLKNIVAFNHYDSRLLRGAALDEGDINIFVFMRKLLARQIDAPIAIENILTGDKRALVKRDLAYLRSVMSDILNMG